MKNFNTNTENNDEWLTPPDLIKALGEFDLDPCAPHPNKRPWAMAKNHYHAEMDGLKLHWKGRIWLNPPYGRETFEWLERLAEHKNGIALIFARTETRGFHEQIWNKANAIFFFQGRLKFHKVSGEQGNCANAPSCLVSYSNKDSLIIEKAWENGLIKGKLIFIHEK